eukprot:TRINITY_DN6810_c0_g1_i2.p1 TRINITY_DN6810_c0_g1~~TRINITY_DN6810_c0_g1_i2.p1  ORF type:complete len:477 (-),score=126.27 TRINITY_DN6810_c0_g1_i2:175-1539(-)
MAMKRPAASAGRAPKRAAVDQSAKKCSLIAEALAEAELDKGVKDMLKDCVKPSLCTYKDDRHAYQSAMVDMLGETLDGIEQALKKHRDEARTIVSGSEEERAARQNRKTEAEESLSTKQSALTAAGEAATASTNAQKESAVSLKQALDAQKAGDAELQQAGTRRETLEKARTELFLPCKEAAGKLADVKKLCAIAKQFSCDGALVESLPLALTKEPAARGSFDGLAVEQFAQWLDKTLSGLSATMATGDAASAERAAAVEAAKNAKAEADKAAADAKAALVEATNAVKEAKVGLKAATSAVDSFEADRRRMAEVLDKAEAKLRQFQEGALAAFRDLRDLAPPPPVMEPAVQEEPRICGGIGDEKPADDDVRTLIAPLKADAQAKAQEQGWNGTFTEFEAVSYKTQVVAGMNYFVKVKLGPSDYVHLRVYKHFSGASELSSVKVGCSSGEPISYF